MIPTDHSSGILYCVHINLIRWWILLQRFSPFFRSSAIIWPVPGAIMIEEDLQIMGVRRWRKQCEERAEWKKITENE